MQRLDQASARICHADANVVYYMLISIVAKLVGGDSLFASPLISMVMIDIMLVTILPLSILLKFIIAQNAAQAIHTAVMATASFCWYTDFLAKVRLYGAVHTHTHTRATN